VKERVLIIDGLNFIYRGLIGFFGGKPAVVDYTIVFNFFRNLRALIESFEPSKCFFILEGQPEFRKVLFPDYKKNRIVKIGSTQEQSKLNIFRQADIIYKLIRLLPITMVRAAAYEDDDTIYTLANDLKNEEVIIVSSDSDMIQIIQNLSSYDVKLFNPRVKEFIKVPAYVYLVRKSIAGDKSDNIPSVASAKKADLLATDAEALKEFLSNEENRANFSLNKELIELRLVPPDQLEFIESTVDFNALFNEFEKLEFSSLLKESYKEKFIQTFTDNLT
jgi:5'-3' exonuclease